MKQTFEIVVDVNREKLFDLFIDIARSPEYVDDVESVKELMPVNDELRFLITYKPGVLDKKEVQILERVYDIKRPDSYMFTFDLEGINNSSIVQFIPVTDHSTKLIAKVNVTSKSAMARFLIWIGSLTAKKKTRKMLAKFKSWAENAVVNK